MSQIILMTRYWTKFSIAAVVVSVVMFFVCTRITHSTRLFLQSPKDYYFLGTVFKTGLVVISLSLLCGCLKL